MIVLLRRTIRSHLRRSRPEKILNVFQRIHLRFFRALRRSSGAPHSPRHEDNVGQAPANFEGHNDELLEAGCASHWHIDCVTPRQEAGREVRIIVKPEAIDDLASARLARDVAKKIEETMQYPGQIRVTVIRETRSTEIAK